MGYFLCDCVFLNVVFVVFAWLVVCLFLFFFRVFVRLLGFRDSCFLVVLGFCCFSCLLVLFSLFLVAVFGFSFMVQARGGRVSGGFRGIFWRCFGLGAWSKPM